MADYMPFGVSPPPDAPASAEQPFPPEVMAMLLAHARGQLAAQDNTPGGAAQPPMSPADQAAMSPETFANPAVKSMIGSIASLPQRAIENSQNSLNTGTYDPGPTLEAATLPMGTGAIAGVPMRAGEAAFGAGPIRAYHGSPHDFDAFDLSKIGTGEGAQAYGHGLYFAENPAVATGYKETLGGDTLVTPKGTVFDPMTLEHMNVRSRAHSNGSNLDATIETAQKIAESDSPVADMAKRDLDKLLALKAEGGVKRNPGKMYEVNINADPEHFLDWDKPLNPDTLAKVQAAAKNIKPSLYERMMGEGKDLAKWALQPENIRPDLTGQSAIGTLKRGLGSDAAASQALREAGVPGIKYLDQGSRTAGEGSRNYVVFNDKLVDILKKYGIAGLIGGAGGVGALGQKDGT